jgi:hypothetical protein
MGPCEGPVGRWERTLRRVVRPWYVPLRGSGATLYIMELPNDRCNLNHIVPEIWGSEHLDRRFESLKLACIVLLSDLDKVLPFLRCNPARYPVSPLNEFT